MTKINHRRKNKKPVAFRYEEPYRNGYSIPSIDKLSNSDEDYERKSYQRVGKTGFLDKSLHGWSRKSDFADIQVWAGIGNDFCCGHRGMAKAVKGAKKYVRTRIRFQEKMKTIEILKSFSKDDLE